MIPSHQEDVPSVQAVAAQAPRHVLVGNTRSVFSLEHHHAGERDSFHCFDHLRSGAYKYHTARDKKPGKNVGI